MPTGTAIKALTGTTSPVHSGTEWSLPTENADGTYTPDNPLSSLYPNLVEGKKVRVAVTKGSTYAVTVKTQPAKPTQTCVVTAGRCRTSRPPVPRAPQVRTVGTTRGP